MFGPFIIFGISLLNPKFPDQKFSFAFAESGAWALAAIIAIIIGNVAATYPSRFFALLGKSHLQNTLRAFLSYSWRMDCYAVISCRARTIDEDCPFIPDYQDPRVRPDPEYAMSISPYYEYIPLYRNLSMLSAETSIRVLTASAALPLGIIRSESIRGMNFEDGGLSDNRPIFPLISRSEQEQLLVILLSPVLKDGKVVDLATREGQDVAKTQIVVELMNTGRSRRRRYAYRRFVRQFSLRGTDDMVPLSEARGQVGQTKLTGTIRHLLNSEQLRESSEVLSNRTVTIIAPSRNLGGLFDGTLAFFPSTIEKFNAEGEADAYRILNGLMCIANLK